MRSWPTDPMRQHDRLIAAICDDMIETGKFSLDGPNTTRVAEINRQINSTRDGSEPNKPLPTNNGDQA